MGIGFSYYQGIWGCPLGPWFLKAGRNGDFNDYEFETPLNTLSHVLATQVSHSPTGLFISSSNSIPQSLCGQGSVFPRPTLSPGTVAFSSSVSSPLAFCQGWEVFLLALRLSWVSLSLGWLRAPSLGLA